jgi:hypothetical protein
MPVRPKPAVVPWQHPSMDPRSARTALAGIRAAVGLGAILAPRLTSTLLGIDPDANPAAPYLARIFGVRELYMASPFLMPAPGVDERELASRAVPVDALDAVAAFAGGVGGYLPWRTALPAAAAGAFGTYLGWVASRPT